MSNELHVAGIRPVLNIDVRWAEVRGGVEFSRGLGGGSPPQQGGSGGERPPEQFGGEGGGSPPPGEGEHVFSLPKGQCLFVVIAWQGSPAGFTSSDFCFVFDSTVVTGPT